MASRQKKASRIDGPEYIVSREAFDRYFERPLPSSTFYDLVEKGEIIAWPHMRGRYYLNASLQRLGLPTASELPKAVMARSMEDICRLAFTLIDPVVFPAPPWLLSADAINTVVADHATRIAKQYGESVTSLNTIEEKLAYLGGVLDAQFMLEADERV
ncbi:MAG: hypothetical protein KDN20_15345 [Verrucomicrobiae bacterium]|nr:hypothetical protein [Verrucomicrobiae bacterium]